MKTILSIFLLSLLFTTCDKTEPDTVPEHRKSPVVITSLTKGDTYIKVVYGQPYRRDRVIFGDVVPFNEVWRTGANEATEILFTNDVLLNGNRVEAGIYSLFTIPREDNWTIILNNALGEWGAFTYDENMDYLRFDVPVNNAPSTIEAFSISFDDSDDSTSSMFLTWEDMLLEIDIEFIDS
jgi:hypothetical protein